MRPEPARFGAHRDPAAEPALHIVAEEVVRKRRLRARRGLESLRERPRDLELQGAEVVLELRERRRAEDRGRDTRARGRPVEGDLRGRPANLPCDREQLADDLQFLSVALEKRAPPVVASRPEPTGPFLPGLYLPVSNPLASGLQMQTPIPSSSAAGTCSRSIERSTSEYSSWSAATRSLPRSSAIVWARARYHAGTSESPK